MTEPETHGLDVDGFLVELAELTQRYGIQIDGCGHCEAPLLAAFDNHVLGDGLTYYISEGVYRATP